MSSESDRVRVRKSEREVVVEARSELALVEQIEIAAGDENSGETGESEAKKGRARPQVLLGAILCSVART